MPNMTLLYIVYLQPPVINGTAYFYANRAMATNEGRNQIKPVNIFYVIAMQSKLNGQLLCSLGTGQDEVNTVTN
jgi:hypothetical protein